MDKEGIHGKVATDYLVFGRLPILKQYYKPQFFPHNTSVDLLATVAKASGVCYILIAEEELGVPAREALDWGLFRTVLIEGRRRLIKTCLPE